MLPSGKEVEVINIMADGSICEDLAAYMNTHELPEDAKRMVAYFIRKGRELREDGGG